MNQCSACGLLGHNKRTCALLRAQKSKDPVDQMADLIAQEGRPLPVTDDIPLRMTPEQADAYVDRLAAELEEQTGSSTEGEDQEKHMNSSTSEHAEDTFGEIELYVIRKVGGTPGYRYYNITIGNFTGIKDATRWRNRDECSAAVKYLNKVIDKKTCQIIIGFVIRKPDGTER